MWYSRQLTNLFECIFNPSHRGIINKIFNILFIIFLFFIGIIHWVLFFNLGYISFYAYDWSKEFKYYSILKQAIQQCQIPYYMSKQYQYTHRFLAIPEVVLSPQIALLGFMNINWFVIFNVIFLYAIGFIGCLLIKKRYQLSLFSFSLLYLIFNFNGHIISHFSVGHSMWGGYFLLPYFFLFVLKLIEGDFSIHDIGKLSLTLFFILLQGSVHIYIWCVIFLLLLCISKKKYLKPVFSSLILSALFATFRFLPAMLTFLKHKFIFISGYNTLQILLDALITIRPHTYNLGILKGEGYFSLGWWEYDTYIGLVGLGFILYYGVYLHFFKKIDTVYHDLHIPIIGQTIFSLGFFYAFISVLPVPLIGSERTTSRFFIIPLLMLTILASIRLQKVINEHEWKKKPVIIFWALVGIFQMAFSFITHSITWSLMTIERAFQDKAVDLSIRILPPKDFIINQPHERLYFYSLKIGLIISSLAILIFFLWTLRLKTKKVPASSKSLS